MHAYSASAFFQLRFHLFILFLNTEREDICFISEGINSQIVGPKWETDSLPLDTINMWNYKLRYFTKILMITFS